MAGAWGYTPGVVTVIKGEFGGTKRPETMLRETADDKNIDAVIILKIRKDGQCYVSWSQMEIGDLCIAERLLLMTIDSVIKEEL